MGKEEKRSNGESRYEGGALEKEEGGTDKENSKRDNGKIRQERKRGEKKQD